MRTLIFSDTHLTHEYSLRHDAFLRNLISSADRVIVNGDFWDAFHTDWNRLANSPWQTLFSLLRQKKADIIWGNHDLPAWTKDPELFGSSYQERILLPVGKKLIQIEHGHLIAPSFDVRHPFLSWNFSRYVPYRYYSFKPDTWFNVQADESLRQAAQALPGNTFFVAGHSHVPVLDASLRYANSGLISGHRASWLQLENGRISLHTSAL